MDLVYWKKRKEEVLTNPKERVKENDTEKIVKKNGRNKTWTTYSFTLILKACRSLCMEFYSNPGTKWKQIFINTRENMEEIQRKVDKSK